MGAQWLWCFDACREQHTLTCVRGSQYKYTKLW